MGKTTLTGKGKGILKAIVTEILNSQNRVNGKPGFNNWRPNSNGNYPGVPIYIDALISPSFFRDQFIEAFGEFAFYFTIAGQWFAAFLLLQYVYKIIVSILRGLNIHTMVGDSVSVARIATDAILTLF